VPLLFLFISLAAAAAAQPAPVELATAWFKLVVGLTVNLAALGYFFSREDSRLDVPFPVHNFFLLGVRILLWIFRLVGLWWIWQGLAYVLNSNCSWSDNCFKIRPSILPRVSARRRHKRS